MKAERRGKVPLQPVGLQGQRETATHPWFSYVVHGGNEINTSITND
jgi:hypothetical protein